MRAKIIAVVNQKGGCGKTTISMQLAGTLAQREKTRVLVVDADEQGTATRWAANADDDKQFPAAVVSLWAANTKVHREVRKFVDDYDYIIIDCPPAADSLVPKSALLIADLALVPIIPSGPDLWAAVRIREAIEAARTTNEELKARLILNECDDDTVLAREVIEILPEFEIEVCQVHLGFRQVYRQSATYGTTVHEYKKKVPKAAEEIDALTEEVLSVLKGSEARVANL